MSCVYTYKYVYTHTCINIFIFSWFHPNLNRHHAEALLIQNGQDGSYLLRHCTSEKADYVLSCRCVNSVKHFQIKWDGKFYKFGMGLFSNFSEFVKHFENKPLIGGESGLSSIFKVY